ncbi:MAG: PA14 domain-containing protein [Chloroflexota bacterium]
MRLPRLIMVALTIVLLTLGFSRPVVTHADTGTNWTGAYFNNRDLQGSPVFTRIDPAVVFNWGSISPGPGIGSSNWSARWQTVQYLNAGTYRFTIIADDGVRVYVDGQLILDQWHDAAPTKYYVDVQAVAGNHIIQVDYYQGVGDASLTVYWDYSLAQSSAWTAQYYNNPNLDGAAAVTRYETSINYFWGTGSPASGIGNDNFSARWTATLPFSSATYRFTLAGDDGVRLFIDNASVINQWKTQTLTAYSIDVPLSAGLHTLRVEYFDSIDQAAVRFDYAVAVGPPPYPGTTSDQWYGEYFANPNLQGSPSFIRFDGTSGINFNWSVAPPVANFPRESFSVRWTRRLFFPGRPYLFYVTVDDGARLYIDTTLIIDAWKPQSAVTITKNVDLTEGYHIVRLEYFQDHFESVIGLTWNPPNSQTPPQYPGGVPPPVPGVGTGSVNTHALNVRTGPGVNYDILTTIKRGDTFTVLGRNTDASWIRVNAPNVTGWINTYYVNINGSVFSAPVEVPPPPPPPSPTGVRAKLFSNLRFHTGPGSNFPAVGTLGWGTIVDMVGRNSNGAWYQVQYAGLTGWIYSPYVRIVAGTLSNVPIVGG